MPGLRGKGARVARAASVRAKYRNLKSYDQIKRPTEKQLLFLARLGVTSVPETKADASKLISEALDDQKRKGS